MVQETKKQTVQGHEIMMKNRSELTVTGVSDVSGFDDDKIDLKTNMGRLLIRGKSLSIHKLDTQDGRLAVTGEIKIMEYTDKGNKEGIFAGLFK